MHELVFFSLDGTPSGYPTANSKRALAFAPPSPVGRPFPHPDFKDCRDESPTATLLDKRLKRAFAAEEANDSDLEVEPSSSIGHRSRSPTVKRNMTATPTYGNSCFPFAVNCRYEQRIAFVG